MDIIWTLYNYIGVSEIATANSLFLFSTLVFWNLEKR